MISILRIRRNDLQTMTVLYSNYCSYIQRTYILLFVMLVCIYALRKNINNVICRNKSTTLEVIISSARSSEI